MNQPPNKNAPELAGSQGAIQKSDGSDFTALQAAFAQRGHHLNHVTNPDGTAT